MSETPKPPENPLEIYKIYRDYVEHEDALIHHRTTSLITIQSFLIATFGFAYQKSYEIAEKLLSRDTSVKPATLGNITDEYNLFLLILAIVGLGTSIIAWRSIVAATKAIKGLKEKWNNLKFQNPVNHLPGLTGGGDEKVTEAGLSLSIRAPQLFIALWVLIILLILVKIWLKS